jgi:uridine phosphorylase
VTRSWYLDLAPNEIAERCVLVGDPGRVELFAAQLDTARVVAEQRGLRVVTGSFDGTAVTIAAFGMGAPIAVIILEELVALGARTFLRAGTAMSLGELSLGSFVVALAAVRGEGTSLGYAPVTYPAVANFALTEELVHALSRAGVAYRVGVLVSEDAFYQQLFTLVAEQEQRLSEQLAEWRRLHVLAADMETSALLTVGAVLGVQVAAVCLISVDAITHRRLDPLAMEVKERELVEVALHTVTSSKSVPLNEGVRVQ